MFKPGISRKICQNHKIKLLFFKLIFFSLIATPGRLLHVSVEMNLRLSHVQYIVFDEADRLFEMGFAEQLHVRFEIFSTNLIFEFFRIF